MFLSSHSGLLCKSENVACDEGANLVEDRDEVLVSRRDLRVLLEASLLQDAVEHVCLVDWLATAVDEREDLQVLDVYLVCLCGVSLESRGKKGFRQCALRISQRLPCRRWQLLSERLQSDKALITALFLCFIDFCNQHGHQCAVEGK